MEKNFKVKHAQAWHFRGKRDARVRRTPGLRMLKLRKRDE